MGRRKSAVAAVVVEDNATDNSVADAVQAAIEAAATVVSEDVDINALLESVEGDTSAASTVIDNDTGETVTDGTTEIVADEPADTPEAEMEEVEVDVDQVLAQINGDGATDADQTPADATATDKPKRTRKAAEPKVATRQFTEVATMSRDDFKAVLDAESTAKKIREKGNNLIEAIEKGTKLSNYTKIAVKALANDGKVSGKSLTEAYTAAGLKIGTARAQSQQLTSLFKLSGICAPDATTPRELVIADQKLVDELVLLAA